jgi:hypothetical protein
LGQLAISCGLLLVLFTAISCTLRNFESPFEKVRNENRARNDRDFDEYYPNGAYKLDFKIGDRFRLKKPMFLHHAITGVVYLTPPNDASGPTPSVKEYLSNPKAYAFGGNNSYRILRLAPERTVIRLVAIKDSSQAGYLTYFVFEGEDEWFRSAQFAVSSGHGDSSDTYSHEYFTKLPIKGVSNTVFP